LGDVVLTNDAKEVLADPDIDIVVELIGGYKPAKEFILEAIANKKACGHREQGRSWPCTARRSTRLRTRRA